MQVIWNKPYVCLAHVCVQPSLRPLAYNKHYDDKKTEYISVSVFFIFDLTDQNRLGVQKRELTLALLRT